MGTTRKKISPGQGPGRAVFAAIGLLSALLVLAAWWMRPQLLSAIDLKAADAMSSLRGARPAPSDVVIVAVDGKSVDAFGRWPWDRAATASLVSALSGARTIALDIVFSEPTGEQADLSLSAAVAGHPGLVLGYFFRSDTDEPPDPAALGQLGSSKISILSTGGAPPGRPTWPLFSSVETNTAIIGRGAKGFGAFNALPGGDGLYRDAGLVFGYDGDVYPALALEAASRHLGGVPLVRLASYGVDGISVGEMTVPVDESGAMSLNFYGPSGAFKTYSAVDVVDGRVDPGELAGKLVFVGVTEKAVYDMRPTPLDPVYPGVELHATAAGNILTADFLVRDGRVILFDVFVTVAAALALALVLSGVRRTVAGLAAFAALVVLVAAGEFALFSIYSVKTAVVYPVLSLVVCYMSGEAYRNLVVEKRTRFLRRAFSSYVSAELVAEILDDPGRLRLGGERREVTVLFSDIRGFTGISERLSPEELVEFLNRYLSPMTAIVLDEKGMVDKYIGDAIMAVFNAPVEVEGHAARACSAALRMKEALASFNARWVGSGYPAVEIGIGMNTGEAVVGNMGAELKLNYTAIGDAVNLASRLEPMNKEYGTTILVSAGTAGRAGEGFVFRELDSVRVRGREAPLAVYELLGRAGHSGLEGLARRFGEGLALYRARRFQEAGAVFDALARGGDGPSEAYAARCERFAAAPPPADWDLVAGPGGG